MKMQNGAPMGQPRRVSADSVWPLRGADGLTFAERKANEQARTMAASEAAS